MVSMRRHLFEERKYVEEYRMQDVEAEMALDQQGLVRMALLLGSDYTEGIKGIGVVNAFEVVRLLHLSESFSLSLRSVTLLQGSKYTQGIEGNRRHQYACCLAEIALIHSSASVAAWHVHQRRACMLLVARASQDVHGPQGCACTMGANWLCDLQVRAFPTDEALRDFREWVNLPPAALASGAQGKLLEGTAPPHLQSTAGAGMCAALSSGWPPHSRPLHQLAARLPCPIVMLQLRPCCACAGEQDDELARKFKQSHKAARKTWALPDSFPNHVVVNAYVSPTVDTSREKCAAPWPHGLRWLLRCCCVLCMWALAYHTSAYPEAA